MSSQQRALGTVRFASSWLGLTSLTGCAGQREHVARATQQSIEQARNRKNRVDWCASRCTDWTGEPKQTERARSKQRRQPDKTISHWIVSEDAFRCMLMLSALAALVGDAQVAYDAREWFVVRECALATACFSDAAERESVADEPDSVCSFRRCDVPEPS